MKLKLKLMAAAVALVASAGANAAIQNAATNSGGLTPHQSEGVFTAYGNGFAYTFDLGQAGFNSLFGTDTKLNNLVTSTDTVLTSASTIQVLQQPANGIIFDMALPSFNSFLTSAGTSGIQFNVAFGDSIGTDRWLTTLQSPLGTTAGGMTAFDGIGASFNTYVGAVSTKMTANGSATSLVSTDGWAITTAADTTAYGALYANNFGGAIAGMDNTGELGGSVAMAVLYGSSSITPTAKAFAMNGINVTAETYLAQDGQWHLEIAAVQAIPEPSEYALMLAGLGMLGFMARRRLANRA